MEFCLTLNCNVYSNLSKYGIVVFPYAFLAIKLNNNFNLIFFRPPVTRTMQHIQNKTAKGKSWNWVWTRLCFDDKGAFLTNQIPLLLLRVYCTFIRQTCVMLDIMGIFIPRITWSLGGYASLLQAKHLNTLQQEHSVLNSPSGGSRISHTGWGPDPKRQGRQPIIWATFPRALHELGKNWTQVGGGD